MISPAFKYLLNELHQNTLLFLFFLFPSCVRDEFTVAVSELAVPLSAGTCKTVKLSSCSCCQTQWGIQVESPSAHTQANTIHCCCGAQDSSFTQNQRSERAKKWKTKGWSVRDHKKKNNCGCSDEENIMSDGFIGNASEISAAEFPASRCVCKDINLFFQTIHLPLKYSSSC